MSRRAERFRDIARRAEMDLDDALLTAWAADLEFIDGPSTTVPARLVPTVERVLGILSERELATVHFWERELGLSGQALAQRFADFGVELSPKARRLPKGAVKKLRHLVAPKRPEAVLVARRGELAPFEWVEVGSHEPTRFLSDDDVLAIHDALVEDFAASDDPIFPPGPRNLNLLSSAVQRPRTSLGDALKYPTIEMAGAALMHSLVLNHPFHNGNKRTALVSLLVFLDENGMTIDVDQNEVFKFTLKVARRGLVPDDADNRSDREVLEIARWIRCGSRSVDRSNRPMKWVRLQKVLRSHGCEFDYATVGNRINIRRVVKRRRGFLGRERLVELRCQAKRSGDGADADRDTVSYIRRSLELDEDHGVDTERFLAGTAEDEFILQYRRTLRRLGKL